MSLTCPYCSSTTKHWKIGKGANGLPRFICRNCNRKFTSASKGLSKRRPPQEINCLNCGKTTTNPKFCSLRCSAIHNNRVKPIREYIAKSVKEYSCKYCNMPTTSSRKVCENCNQKLAVYSKRTIGEVQNVAKYQINAVIRQIARATYAKAKLPRTCRNCGYDKHIEICHIHAISEFSDDTPIAVINDLANLVALCPNCHWEFDHGLLKLD